MLVMAGTGNLASSTSNDIALLTISASAHITIVESVDATGLVLIDGELTIASGKQLRFAGSLTFGASGVATGAGTLNMNSPAGLDLVTLNGTDNMTGLAVFRVTNPKDDATNILSAGTYGANLTDFFGTQTGRGVNLSGTFVFGGDWEFTTSAGAMVIDNSVNNPNITVQGDVIWNQAGGTITYTKGTGTLTFDGTADQDIDFGGSALENIVINKESGTLTFGDDWVADSFTHQRGVFDPDGLTLETVGAFRILPGAEIVSGVDAWNGVALTVGGAFLVIGTPANKVNLRATVADDWTLDVTGSARAFDVDVSYSDALSGGGSEIVAIRSTDSGNNQNWVFAAGGLGADDATPLLFGLGMQMGNSPG
jgi:hypothetical protein